MGNKENIRPMTLSVRIKHAFPDFSLDVDFTVPTGITALFGRSGSGKTTIINAIAGLIQPDQGRISINGTDLVDTESDILIPAYKRRIGYIFQESRLLPHLSVQQNLFYSRWLAPKVRRADNAGPVLEMLGIGHLLKRRPGDLSGGEKQRVAIGRALLSGPQLLLADEPLAALDEARKAEILPYFERLRDELKLPILYVSHSAAEVGRLANAVVAVDGGGIIGQGTAAAVFSDPAVMPAGVRAVGAVLEANVVDHHSDGLTELNAGGVKLLLPRLDHALGRRIRIRIAAQDVILSRECPAGLSALNVFPGTVSSIRTGVGPGAMVSLDTSAGTVLSRITSRSAGNLALREGVPCYAIVKSVAVAPEDIGGIETLTTPRDETMP